MTHYVYRLFDVDGVLLYIGESINPEKRVKQHRSAARWGRQIRRMKVSVFPDRVAALYAEREAISSEHPRFNVLHAGAPVVDKKPAAPSSKKGVPWTPQRRFDYEKRKQLRKYVDLFRDELDALKQSDMDAFFDLVTELDEAAAADVRAAV